MIHLNSVKTGYMEKRDYLIDQIEQFGQALAMIFSKLMDFRSQGKVPEAIEMTSLSLKTVLNLNLNELLAIPTDEFVFRMKENKKFNYANLELLADILLHVADETAGSNPDSMQSLNLYDKALKVYIYLNERDLTFSFERQSKIERIESLLF
jgi:hypothetical protein